MAVYIWYASDNKSLDVTCHEIEEKKGQITQMVVLKEHHIPNGSMSMAIEAVRVALIYSPMEGQ